MRPYRFKSGICCFSKRAPIDCFPVPPSASKTVIYGFMSQKRFNRTFVQDFLAQAGDPMVLPIMPSPELFMNIVRSSFGVMDLVFLAICFTSTRARPHPRAKV